MLCIIGKDDIRKLLDEVKGMKANLDELAAMSTHTSDSYGVQRKSVEAASKYFSWIRRHSINIHEALKQKLLSGPTCLCTCSHLPSLQLAVRTLSTAPPKSLVQNSNSPRLRFGITLDFGETSPKYDVTPPWMIRDMEVEPIEVFAQTTPSRTNVYIAREVSAKLAVPEPDVQRPRSPVRWFSGDKTEKSER